MRIEIRNARALEHRERDGTGGCPYLTEELPSGKLRCVDHLAVNERGDDRIACKESKGRASWAGLSDGGWARNARRVETEATETAGGARHGHDLIGLEVRHGGDDVDRADTTGGGFASISVKQV